MYSWNEDVFEPLPLSKIIDRFALDCDLIDTRILSQRMITKDINSLDVFALSSCFRADLSESSIMVESAEASDVLRVSGGGVMIENVCVSVCRICNDKTFYVLFSY